MLADHPYRLEKQTDAGGSVRLVLSGRVEIASARALLDDLLSETATTAPAPTVDLDLSRVEYFDSGGGAVLAALRLTLASGGRELRLCGTTPAIDGFLALLDQEAVLTPRIPVGSRTGTIMHRVGAVTLQLLRDLRVLMLFTGEVILGVWDAIRHPRRLRRRETWQYMERCGLDALPIVSLISFLMGMITGFQAAVQLTQFGADVYIANLVGLSITRELGPLMTAIIAAGRSGAAFAAEIGTMKVAEEVDALTTMGLDRTRFLVTPKVVSLLVMLPCLTLFADVVGIAGGMSVAVFGLDLPSQVYLRQIRRSVRNWDVFSGLLKSVAFALLVAGVGCLRGLQARSGAESVGRVTTSAIVAGIFLIIVADAVFTVIFHFW